MRQLAWLHAVPKTPSSKSVGKTKQPEEQRSRLKKLMDEGKTAALPDIPLPYLATWFLEVGPSSPGGFGPVPLTQLEIRAWQENMGLALTPWEATSLQRLSRAYVDEYVSAADPQRPPPFASLPRLSREAVENKIDEIL